MRKFTCICLLAVILLGHRVGIAKNLDFESSKQTSVQSGWSDRNVFSLEGFVFDFRKGRFGGGANTGQVTDCTNELWYCLTTEPMRISGDRFELVLPRSCSVIERAKVGTAWVTESIETVVLYIADSRTPPPHGGSNRMLYLGNDDLPHVVWVYDTWSGVSMMLWDASHKLNFVAMAREGELASWLRIGPGDAYKSSSIYSLSTFDPFGPCKKT